MGSTGPVRSTLIPLISVLTNIAGTETESATIYLYTQFTQAMSKLSSSLGKLYTQIDSLSGIVLQNRWALNFLTKAKGGTCPYLGDEYCFYINRSGLITKNYLKLIKSIFLYLCHYSQTVIVWLKTINCLIHQKAFNFSYVLILSTCYTKSLKVHQVNGWENKLWICVCVGWW